MADKLRRDEMKELNTTTLKEAIERIIELSKDKKESLFIKPTHIIIVGEKNIKSYIRNKAYSYWMHKQYCTV